MRQHIYYVPNISQWLQLTRPQGGVIGADPKLFSQSKWQELSQAFKHVKWSLLEIQTDLIDVIWTQRPVRRNKKVFLLDEKYTGLSLNLGIFFTQISGKTWTKKIYNIRRTVQRFQADAFLVTSLDEIAWLLNIRGRDIPSSPLVRSYLLVDMDRVWFYINQTQLANQVSNKLITSAQAANLIIEYVDTPLTTPSLFYFL